MIEYKSVHQKKWKSFVEHFVCGSYRGLLFTFCFASVTNKLLQVYRDQLEGTDSSIFSESSYFFRVMCGCCCCCCTPSQLHQNMGTEASLAISGSTSSSTLADIPANLLGSGPIILTSCGTSRDPIVQNFRSAFMQRHTCSSGGLP